MIKQFAYDMVVQIERDNPSLYITKMTKAERTNRIYLDYLRNDRESTAIAPFSPERAQGHLLLSRSLGRSFKTLSGRSSMSLDLQDGERDFRAIHGRQ